MSTYIVPQLQVQQVRRRIPTATMKHQNAFIIGPNYQPVRYSESSEKDNGFLGAYEGLEVSSEWPNLISDAVVDLDYAKVYVDNAYLAYTSDINGSIDASARYKLDLNSVETDASGLEFDEAVFSSRGPRVGDYVILSDALSSEADVTRRIVGFENSVIAATVGVPTDSEGTSASLFTSGDGVFEASTDTTYIVEILTSGDTNDSDEEDLPTVRVTDSSGIDVSATYTLEAGENLRLGNYGPTFTIDSGTATTGDIFTVACTAETNGVRDIVLLNKAVDTMTDVTAVFHVVRDGIKIDAKFSEDTVLVAEDDSAIEVTQSDILVNDVAKTLTLVKGDLYVEYRALLKADANTINSVETSNSDIIESALGPIDKDNPLALGVYLAAINSDDKVVYYSSVASNDSDGYSAALEQSELKDEVYGIVPLTTDTNVLEIVKAHINEMSTPTEKLWRIGFFGANVDFEKIIYENNSDGLVLKATTSKSDPTSDNYDTITFEEALDYGNYTTRVGDYVNIDYQNGVPQVTAKIVSKLDDQTYVVDQDMGSFPVAVKATVERVFTGSEVAANVAAESESYFDFRIYNVFPDDAITIGGQVVGSEFVASAVSGLVSSVAAHQGITNVSLEGFSDLPIVYNTFTKTQLNTMAASGTLIVMQDNPGGKVYIRHQISTMRSDGSLNTTELSLVKNADSVSYYFADKIKPLIGKSNVTASLVNRIDVELEDGLAYLGSTRTEVANYGPQINSADSSVELVEQDPIYKDRINMEMIIDFPPPFNSGLLKIVM